MKVETFCTGEMYEPGDEADEACWIRVDGQQIAQASNFSECPEDANLRRDLAFVYALPQALLAAYRAGERGEGFEHVEIPNAEP